MLTVVPWFVKNKINFAFLHIIKKNKRYLAVSCILTSSKHLIHMNVHVLLKNKKKYLEKFNSLNHVIITFVVVLYA